MVYLFVGAGQAGSAIVDDVFNHDRMSVIASPVAFNSTVRDLQNLSNVPEEDWYGIAESEGLVRGDTAGFEERVTGGFGRNPERANAVMESNEEEILTVLEERFGGRELPFVFLFLGLGGGTGCGIAPHLADAIKTHTDGNAQVVAVGILPNTQGPVSEEETDEISAGRQARNAVYGLDRLEDSVDGIVLVDNQRLAYEDAAEGRFAEYNEYVASAIVDLISGPVLEQIDPSEHEDVDVPVVDIQDILTAISFGAGRDTHPGYAALGRSVTMTKSLAGYFLPLVGKKSVDGSTLSRLAASKQTIEGARLENARKAIGLVRSPSRYVTDDDYRIQVSVIRRYFEQHCPEVNLGVTLTRRNLASFTTLITYEREDLDRIAELERIAEEYRTEEVVM